MMRTAITVFLILALTGCNSKPGYQRVIDRYLEDHLKDPGSYENISLGTPKIVTPMTVYLQEANKRVRSGELSADSAYQTDRIKAFYISKGTDPYDTLAWEVSHRYRARNSYGALEIQSVTYRLNKQQTAIIKVIPQ